MRVDWHQDGAYWPLEPMNVITLWLAVDRSDKDNGCLKVVRGTHKENLKVGVWHVRVFTTQNTDTAPCLFPTHCSPSPAPFAACQSLNKSADNVLGSSTHTDADLNAVQHLHQSMAGRRSCFYAFSSPLPSFTPSP